MPYFRIDDAWWSHPKTLALTPSARDLWVRAGSYSMQHLTDGLISKQALRILGAKPGDVKLLVAVTYWEEVLVGYQFHDWHDHQETAEQLKEKREKARERMRELRAKQQGTSPNGSTDVRANVPGTNGARSQNVSDPSPSPSRPMVTSGLETPVPETSREMRTDDETIPESDYITRAANLKVDFRKVRTHFGSMIGQPVSMESTWLGIWKVAARGGKRDGDRTGLVLTSLKNDWAEWQQLAYREAS